MIREENFDAASDVSPEMAFVRLERRYREVLEENLENSQSNEAYQSYMVEYFNHTIATAKALGLDILQDWELPDGSARDLSEQYKRFRTEVDHYSVQIQIAHIRSGPKNTVGLDISEKRVLRHYAEQIKEVIDNSSLAVAKKERLLDKINAFLFELDRDRTNLQKFNDVVISLAHTGGEAATELEPAWKWVKLIGEVFGVRQETEQTKLPAPPKKLEPPKRQLPAPKKTSKDDMNDDIPF